MSTGQIVEVCLSIVEKNKQNLLWKLMLILLKKKMPERCIYEGRIWIWKTFNGMSTGQIVEVGTPIFEIIQTEFNGSCRVLVFWKF